MKYKLLGSWIATTLEQNPQIINKNSDVIGFYAELQEEFLKDAQAYLKEFARSVKAVKL